MAFYAFVYLVFLFLVCHLYNPYIGRFDYIWRYQPTMKKKHTHRHIPYMLSDPLCVRIIRNCRRSHHARTQFGTNCSTAQTRCVIGNFNSFSESDMIMHFQFICCCWCWFCVVCRMFARVHLFVRSLRFTHSHLDSCRPPYSHINLNYLSSCRHTYSTLWFRQIELNSTKNALSFFPSIANRE